MADRITTGVWRYLARMMAETGLVPDQAALADARPVTPSGWDIERCDGIPDEAYCGARGPGGECARALGHTDKPFPGYAHDHWSWDTDHFMAWPVGWKSEKQQLAEALARIAELEGDDHA